jgi:hypothetical protein
MTSPFLNRLLIAIIDTIICISLPPLIGIIINFISKKISSILSEIIGKHLAYVVMNYVLFVGTIHHELAHAILAFITGAKVEKVELFNPKNGRLGQVSFRLRKGLIIGGIEAVLASSAPITCGIFSLLALRNLLLSVDMNNIVKGLIYYTMVSIVIHMRMSPEDIQIYKKGILIFSIILIILMYAFNINLIYIIRNLVYA